MKDLNFTGERVVPGKVGALLWSEHMARYRFAADFVSDRIVLDAGCGAGYGSATLSTAGAKSVLGIDIASDAVAYASARYQGRDLDFRVMSVASLELPARAFDVVVSFEVIEHLEDQRAFVENVARVLKEKGLFIVSTPNRAVYRRGLEPNPFHTYEFTLEEFGQLMGSFFRHVRILTQGYMKVIRIGPVFDPASVEEEAVIEYSFSAASADPQYFIALCSNVPDVDVPKTCKLFPFSDESYEKLVWKRRVEDAMREMNDIIPAGETFILADEDQWGAEEQLEGRRRVPFLECNGQYWGPPADDATGIRELKRLRQSGASFLVFAWPAFWWLDYYRGFHEHLRVNFRRVLENERLVVFDLRAHCHSNE